MITKEDAYYLYQKLQQPFNADTKKPIDDQVFIFSPEVTGLDKPVKIVFEGDKAI